MIFNYFEGVIVLNYMLPGIIFLSIYYDVFGYSAYGLYTMHSLLSVISSSQHNLCAGNYESIWNFCLTAH